MNTKFSTLKQSPLFYLALIPIVTLLVTLSWRVAIGQADLYFYYGQWLSNQLALLFSGVVCVSLLMLLLSIKQSQLTAESKVKPMGKIQSFFLALLLAFLTWLALYDVSNFTGTLLPTLFLLFTAYIAITMPAQQSFYRSYGVMLLLMLSIPYIPLLKAVYYLVSGIKPVETAMLHSSELVIRVKDIFFGGLETQLYYYPVAENLNSSVLLGSANANWYDVPAYYGQMTVLKLIHNVGYVPTLLLVMAVFSAWVFAASKIYQAQNVNRFWQQLAYYLALFFIVEAVINVFGNLNIIESVMTTNLMPFSSNAALWVLFIVFGFACWKMQNPQQR